jgi:O-antigen biosynthesis protein
VIAVCLATWEPRPDLLAAQLDSLRAQEGVSWTCVAADDASSPAGREALHAAAAGDERFDVREHGERVGPFRNFERCLARVPAGVEAVAPCDQDDIWHPDKLAALLAALRRRDATLAYGDLRIVDAGGAVLSPTYWTNRDNSWDDLGDLLATNVVTGAASLVRRDVVDVALPFPAALDGAFHDHWLACVALALGDLAYLDRPVVDYVQHGANVVGHAERRRRGERGGGEPLAARAARDRERHVLRPQAFARALLERCADRMSPAKLRAAERAAAGDSSPWGVAAILAGAAREQLAPRRTLEARRRAARGALLGRLRP